MRTLSPEAQDVARKIGEFFLKQNGGSYGETAIEITRMHISRIEIEEGAVRIVLGRPGLLIGKKGGTIKALGEFLGTVIHVEEDETPILDCLIPQELDNFDY